MSKKVLIIGSVVLVILAGCVFGAYYLYKGSKVWYTAYEGPQVETVDNKAQLHFSTVDSLEEICNNLSKHSAFIDVVKPVQKRMPELRDSLKVLEDPPVDIQVDFIAMIHYSEYTDESEFFENVKSSQSEVKRMLSENQYDAIGKESSWSSNLNIESIIDENWIGLDRGGYFPPPKNSVQFRDMARRTIQKFEIYDGVLQFKDQYPRASLMGVEDMDLYFLHERVNELMRTTDGLKAKAYLMRADQVLVWLRTEIAIAKMVTYLKARKLNRGVIVMGQSHRYAAEVLCRKINLKSQNFNSVPLEYRDDEAN